MADADLPVKLKDVKDAHERIRSFIHKTPVMTSSTLDEMASSALDIPTNLLFKCENFQKVGAFKFRGATNAIRSLLFSANEDSSDPLSRPIAEGDLVVITHSSGNHAQALALAAQQQGVTCHVVMPSNAPSVKKDAVRGYGAVVTECIPTLQAREDTVREITASLEAADPRTRVVFVSPYDDPRVIAGQGTMALELLKQADGEGKPLDVLIAPVGGGGMLSGCATAAKGTNPNTWVVGAEPLGADDAYRSFTTKQFHPSVNPKTVADGLLTSLGTNTFPIILQHVDAICTVTEEQIIRAMLLIYERMKIVVEPSSAVTLAVVLYSEEFKASLLRVKESRNLSKINIGLVISGGNVDLVAVGELFRSIRPAA
ncbi:hypothetical protein FRB99_005590 [Tulasnella sp. 403]|nr:hypothetical protein FRB99_005590 [Tulasnella sp. 403]